MEIQEAVNFHMALNKKEESICKHCGQKIAKFLLPFSGLTEPSWYHVCINPKQLRHFLLHTCNDANTCCNPEPIEEKLVDGGKSQ